MTMEIVSWFCFAELANYLTIWEHVTRLQPWVLFSLLYTCDDTFFKQRLILEYNSIVANH